MRCRVLFTRTAKLSFASGIDQQNHAIKLAFSGTARERQSNRMKHCAAAIRHCQLHMLDDLLEAIGVNIAAVEDAIREFADHVARTGARKHFLTVATAQELSGIVGEKQLKQPSQLRASRGMRSKQLCCASQPFRQSCIRIRAFIRA